MQAASAVQTIVNLLIRNGVEGKRLEAKAKDTKKSEAKDSPSEDRPFRGQGQECSRPRTKDTNASVLKKKSSKIFFQAISKKKMMHKKKFFSRFTKF